MSMKAVRVHAVGGPEVLTIEEVPLPVPTGHQVRVKVEAFGVNPVETYIRAATAGRSSPSFPYTPGQDAAGIVDACGPDVTHFKVGDRVFSTGSLSGTYAQYTLVDEKMIQPLAESATFDEGAGIHIPYYTAYHALFHIAKAQAGETVFIHGCSGATGVAALQLARARGLVVIGSAGTSEGIQLIQEQGVELAVNHREDGYLNRVLDHTKGRGVNVIIEMLANVNLGNDLPLLARDGRVAVVGSRGSVSIDPRDLMHRRASIKGVALGSVTPDEIQEINEAIQAGLTKRELHPIIYLTFPFAEVAESHVQVVNPSAGAKGKIIVHPWQ